MTTDVFKSWQIKPSTGRHFDVLDGIRGGAILMVVVFHTFYTNPDAGPVSRAIDHLIGTGWMGVPIFFVLSGFLISYPFFRKRSENGQFWYLPGYGRKRLGKILPPYYLSIALFAIYYYLRFSDPAYLHTALRWALGLANFIPTFLRFNASYWSLIIEVHFYVLLPLLFLFTRGLKPGPTAIVLFLTLFAGPLAVRELTWPGDAASKDNIGFLMSRFPCQLDYFAWGVLFAGVFVALSAPRGELKGLGWLGYAGILLMAGTIVTWAVWSARFEINLHPARWSIEAGHFLPAIAAFLLLFFLFDPDGFGARLLSHPILRFIGIVSYEWFLFHQPVVYLFQDMIGKTQGSLPFYLLKTVVPLLLTFVFSAALYRYFSLPLMKRIRS